MPNLNLSVCTLALNEEKKIEKCLKSVKDWAKEIVVVVDNNSTDQTEKIAKKYTDKVILKKHQPNFHLNKQVAIDEAKEEWVLWLDADEEVTQELKLEIESAINNPLFNAYSMPRKNIIFSKWIEHSGWYPDMQLRLFKNGKAHYPCKKIHEDIKVEGKIGELSSPIVHHNYESVSQFIDKLNKYTSLDAKFLSLELKGKSLLKPILTRPIGDFIKRFLALEGFKDGFHGLALAMLQAFYELVVVIKVWEKRKFAKESMGSVKDVEKVIKKMFLDWKWWRKEVLIKNSKSVKKASLKTLRKLGF